MGADIPKMAVMPHNGQNVLDLMQATLLAKEKTGTKPLITMAMGDLGKITRIAGISFGSAVTFWMPWKSKCIGTDRGGKFEKDIVFVRKRRVG